MDGSFRTFQILADLRNSVLVDPHFVDAPGVASLLASEGAAISDALLSKVSMKLEAWAADPEYSRFAGATAILVAAALEGRVPPAGVLLNWQVFEPAYHALALPARAALLAGFARLGAEIVPAERISTDRIAIISALIAIATDLTDSERGIIARADRHSDWQIHLCALNHVIDEQNCRMTSEQYWYPSEAVELTSHVPGSAGFAGATAILMINALKNGDVSNDMAFRWMTNSAKYPDLPPEVAGPILAGFRNLYETVEDWVPYFMATSRKQGKRVAAIPPALDQFLLPTQ